METGLTVKNLHPYGSRNGKALAGMQENLCLQAL